MKPTKHFIIFLIMMSFAVVMLNSTDKKSSADDFSFKADAFKNGGFIPEVFTCKGENMSPGFSWKNPPEGTKSFAIICEAFNRKKKKVLTHWILYNIPATAKRINKGAADEKDNEFVQGMNDFGKKAYNGPCEKSFKTKYIFKLIALDIVVDNSPAINKEALIEMIEGHVLAKIEYSGKHKIRMR